MNMKEIDNRLSRIGVNGLSDMQREVGEVFCKTNRHLLLLSPTGSGKTLAYQLPMLETLHPESGQLQAVVILPSRELALQSAQVLKKIAPEVPVMTCYGGRTAMDEHRDMKKQYPVVVFATPGRLLDHLEKRNLDFHALRLIVIDEFDKCLNMGFSNEMSAILNKVSPRVRRLFLSATPIAEWPDYVEEGNPLRLDYVSGNQEQRVSLRILRSPSKDKLSTLSALLRSMGNVSTIVFLNHRDSVERVGTYLQGEGFAVSLLHGGMEQQDRERRLYRFRNGSASILVSTDLASRGLDIPEVDNVVHYHLPETQDVCTHRMGRTARWDRLGQTVFLLGPEEHLPEYVNVEEDGEDVQLLLPDYAKTMPVPSPKNETLYLGKGKKDKISKGDIVGFLCKQCGLEGREIGSIDIFERYAYVAVPRDKVLQVMRIATREKIKKMHTTVELMQN